MEQLMKQLTWWSGGGLLVAMLWNLVYPQQFILAVGVTLLVTFYQLAMRLAVGNWLEPRLKLNPAGAWFAVGPGERRLYQLLRVKKWKKLLPTYSPTKYTVQRRSLPKLLVTMVSAEVDHELMFVFSYLPLLLIIPFGEPAIFIVSSVLASLVEVPFIILQRYNRARLVRLLHRQKAKDC